MRIADVDYLYIIIDVLIRALEHYRTRSVGVDDYGGGGDTVAADQKTLTAD